MLRLLFRRNRTTELARLLVALDTLAEEQRSWRARRPAGGSFGR